MLNLFFLRDTCQKLKAAGVYNHHVDNAYRTFKAATQSFCSYLMSFVPGTMGFSARRQFSKSVGEALQATPAVYSSPADKRGATVGHPAKVYGSPIGLFKRNNVIRGEFQPFTINEANRCTFIIKNKSA